MSGSYDPEVGPPADGGATFRVMAPFERARFTPAAWGQLLRARAAGVIGDEGFERLVEQALVQVDGRIGVDELRALFGVAGDRPGGDVTVH